MRDLPADVASIALDSVVAVLACDPQHRPKHGRIGHAVELALPRVATGLRIKRVEPDTVVGDGVMVVLDPAHKACLPDSTPDLGPRDLGRLQELLAEPGVHRERLGPAGTGRLRPCGGVGRQVPPPHGLRERLREHEVQVQNRPARERALGIGKQRRVQSLQVKGRELCEQEVAKVRAGVEADQALVALPGLGPHPAGDVGEPVIKIGTEVGRRLD